MSMQTFTIEDDRETAHNYSTHEPPRYAAHRGEYRLPCHLQNIHRDMTGEDIIRMARLGKVAHVCILRREEDRRKTCWGYRYLVTRDGMSWTAFRTKAGFKRFLRAYNGTYRHARHGEHVGVGVIEWGDTSKWQPIEIRPIPANDPHGYFNS